MSVGEATVRTLLGAVTDGSGRLALFLKPPSSLTGDGARILAPEGCRVEVVPCIAVSFGGGMVHVAADITVPDLLPTLYRPPVRAKGRDGFLPMGAGQCALSDLSSPLPWTVSVDAAEVAQGASRGVREMHARILEEAASFMSLGDGDLILVALGPGVEAPPGRSVSVAVSGIGPVTFTVA